MGIPDFAKKMFDEGKCLGKKSKQGFYDYRTKNKRVNADLVTQLSLIGLNNKQNLTKDVIVDRCVFMMINEAFRCLEENIVSTTRELDLAMIMGTGFPPFRGGLCSYAKTVGISFVVERLLQFQELYGDRFKPCNFLQQCVADSTLLIKKEE